MKPKCSKCGNVGDIIVVDSTLCWCACGHHWIYNGSELNAKRVAVFRTNEDTEMEIRITDELPEAN